MDDLESKFGQINEYIEEGEEGLLMEYIRDTGIKASDYNADIHETYPLDYAATVGNVSIFNYLVNTGYSVEGEEIHPIYEACSKGHLELLETLVETYNIDPSKPDPYGSTPLSIAESEGHLDLVKYLVTKGVSIHTTFSDYEFEDATPLHHAAVSNAKDICQYYISLGANLEARDKHGATPLYLAAASDTEETCRVLLDAGACVEARNADGQTPFFAAVKDLASRPWKDVSSVVRLLYSKGADPEVKNKEGKTPLYHAMSSYSLTYYLLVELNISPGGDNPDARTLFNLASRAKNLDVLNLLVSLGYNPALIDCLDDHEHPLHQTSKGKEVMLKMREIASNPRTLQELSCFLVRAQLGKDVASHVKSLPVAESVKGYVRLSHIPAVVEYDFDAQMDDDDISGAEEGGEEEELGDEDDELENVSQEEEDGEEDDDTHEQDDSN
ncbi:ankyrin repeat, PH and SEC7 domain containing protein secG-like [Haliotis asinina]|uniref:ankyrin repeat, PH and SEC7 domain containing protein secG-like n=1 Tax=Haliotis asinina TaxID=109174 RepID=UPI00353277B1